MESCCWGGGTGRRWNRDKVKEKDARTARTALCSAQAFPSNPLLHFSSFFQGGKDAVA